MATNCKFCGTILEEAQTCNCEGARAAAGAPPAHPFPTAAQPEQEQELDLDQVSGKEEQSQGQVLQAVQERLKNVDYQGIFMEVKNLFVGTVKNPMGTAKQAESITIGGAAAVLGAQAVAFMIMMWASLGKMMSLVGGSVPFRTVIYCLVVALLEIVWMYGALFVFGKVFRSKIGPRELLSTVAVASPVWTATFLLCTIFSVLFGAMGAGSYLTGALFFFALIYSVLILEAAIRSQVPEKVNVLLMLSAAYAVQAMVTARLVTGILSNAAGGIMGGRYW